VPSVERRPRVWCDRHVMDSFWRLAAAKTPLETGGCLAGYYTPPTNDVVVTHVIGPGPSATHRRTRFVPDRAFDDGALSDLWETSNYCIRYVGDWHTHPGGSSHLSSTDKAFMQHALRDPKSFLKYAVVAIVFGQLTDVRFWYLDTLGRNIWNIPGFRELDLVQY
jgi:integrative and conjugative element protein (TIGR02256 family)